MGEHKLNGENLPENPATSSGLSEAIARHATSLIEASSVGNGQMAINPVQLFCDSELHAVRLEVLFEALVAAQLIDPADLTTRLRDKLNAESDQLDKQERPKIQLTAGNLPRAPR